MGFILYCARFSVTLQPYNIYPNTMHRITLTYRHAAAPCPTLGGRTGETVVGGKSGAISTPPQPPFIRLHR